MTDQQAKATLLHSLHVAGQPLVLANAWDAAIVAAAGAPAIATTSAGVAIDRCEVTISF